MPTYEHIRISSVHPMHVSSLRFCSFQAQLWLAFGVLAHQVVVWLLMPIDFECDVWIKPSLEKQILECKEAFSSSGSSNTCTALEPFVSYFQSCVEFRLSGLDATERQGNSAALKGDNVSLRGRFQSSLILES